MSHVRLFERPSSHSAFATGIGALLIAGAFPVARPVLPYEGRLSILNLASAEASIVSVTGAGALPPGYTLRVDNATDEIVLAWPAYQTAAAPITNQGAESDLSGWEAGPGWSTTTDNAISGAKSFVFANQGGSSILAYAIRYAIAAGQSVTASCNVRQGASSAGNAGACVRLEFFDAAGNALTPAEGNMVSSASNNAVKPSSVSAPAPAGAASVRIAARGFRKRQNHRVWADDFAWNHTIPAIGTNVDATIPLTIRIRDSIGREAEWTGDVVVRLLSLWDNSWTLMSTPSQPIDAKPYADATYSYAATPGGLKKTTDYVTWTSIAGPGANIYAFDKNPVTGTMVVANNNYQFSRSTDNGANWSAYAYPTGAGDLGFGRPLYCYNGIWYCTPDSRGYKSLDDGATWSRMSASPQVGLSSGANGRIGYSQVLGKHLRVAAVSGNGWYSLSADGLTWPTIASFDGAHQVYDWAESTSLGIVVASGEIGRIWWTTDGATWTQVLVGTSGHNWIEIEWVPALGQFVMMATGGAVLSRSSDGKTWSAVATNSPQVNTVVRYDPYREKLFGWAGNSVYAANFT